MMMKTTVPKTAAMMMMITPPSNYKRVPNNINMEAVPITHTSLCQYHTSLCQ